MIWKTDAGEKMENTITFMHKVVRYEVARSRASEFYYACGIRLHCQCNHSLISVFARSTVQYKYIDDDFALYRMELL